MIFAYNEATETASWFFAILWLLISSPLGLGACAFLVVATIVLLLRRQAKASEEVARLLREKQKP